MLLIAAVLKLKADVSGLLAAADFTQKSCVWDLRRRY
jgi:hypothetical protein